jgi:hypothetical protein
MQHAVAYYRVSTARQGRSGLGIEAQRAAVARFAEAEGYTLIAEFTEVETGKGADALDRRPQLAAALAAGKSGKCPVIVAKLDRLSRDVAFIAGLMAQRIPLSLPNWAPLHAPPLRRSGGEGTAVDLGADTVGTSPAKGQRRAARQSQQRRRGSRPRSRSSEGESAAFTANVLLIIETLRTAGVRDLRGLAQALNNRGVRTARGGRWHVSDVRNLVDRLPA